MGSKASEDMRGNYTAALIFYVLSTRNLLHFFKISWSIFQESIIIMVADRPFGLMVPLNANINIINTIDNVLLSCG